MELDAQLTTIIVSGIIGGSVTIVTAILKMPAKIRNNGNSKVAGKIVEIAVIQNDIIELKGDVSDIKDDIKIIDGKQDTLIGTVSKMEGMLEGMNSRRRTD